MGKIIRHKKIILFLVVVMLGISSPVLALLVDWPPSPMPPEFREIHGESELHEMIAYIYEWAIALGGIAVFVVLIIAGVQYLTSAGRPEAMRSARDRIQNAVIGIILLLSIWLILNTINPALTTLQPLELNMAEFLSCEIEDGGPCANHDECRGAAEFNSQHAECEKTPPDPVGTCILDQCKTRFGEYYYCENERCVLDEDAWLAGFGPRLCESITLWPEDKRWVKTLKPEDGPWGIPVDVGGGQRGRLDDEGEGFYVQVEFPLDDDRKPYDNCVVHIELYKGAVRRCTSDRERITVTAVRSPNDGGMKCNNSAECQAELGGNYICDAARDLCVLRCSNTTECQENFGKDYMCCEDENICMWTQFQVPDQLYDEYVRCIEYRQIRMPF